MFKAAELGHEVSKKEFARAEEELRGKLLEVQRRVRVADFQTIVIVSGVEAAGKSEVVNRFHEWLDARGLSTSAFWDESDEERERPSAWRFWRRMPPRGSIGIFFGSWYTQPIIDRVFGRLDEPGFDAALEGIASLERMLTDDGAVIVKLWFHLSKKAQRKRLEKLAGKERKLTPWEKKFSRRYETFRETSEQALRRTDAGHSPWHVIDAGDQHHRDLMAGGILLEALEQRLAVVTKRGGRKARSAGAHSGARKTVLDEVDLTASLGDRKYGRRLAAEQARLDGLVWAARRRKLSTVAIFEGWDAAGKGGAIRRVTAGLDARLFRVIPVAAPTDEERAQHYLWRFWRHVPRAGYLTIYDRSWYGRVLVERVEGFAAPEDWGRAYQEINDFERQLSEHGVALAKFWLHISIEEQLRRFEERQVIAHKQHKITAEDWRNREKWTAYEEAVGEMVARCSTAHAPWTLVPANDKRFSRVKIVETIANSIEQSLAAVSRD
ncbi:MAG TPA: polyphosphate:AMP phosphotransferase [Thermoanaerobaculia bacterium]|nr:polyphosphate:AMP phosphotransferase [Thermoanaerobaculia bacterium]